MDLEPTSTEFLHWLDGRGVQINGVSAAFMQGKGRGIVATKQIKEGERVVFVPANALLVVPRPSPSGQNKARPSVHGALALKLLLNHATEDSNQSLLLWWRTMPDAFILKQCMPVFWPERAQQLLPEHAKVLLRQQKAKLDRDWSYFQSMNLPSSRIGLPLESTDAMVYEQYALAWLLVNTRSFYWDYPSAASEASKVSKSQRAASSKKQTSLPTEDCMALVPFIDLFNHTYVGECSEVSFNNEGFTVIAGRDYEPGEEIFVTYGNHSNEFLLVEYGFMMEPNVSDAVSLDQYVIPELNVDQKAILEATNMFGNYNLHASTSPGNLTPPTYCYRTQCALRTIVLAPKEAWRYIESGGSSGDGDSAEDQQKIYNTWKHMCAHVFENIMKVKQRVEEELEEGAPQEILLARWNQISDMVFDTIRD